jgi:hypothetical protein
MEIPHGFQQGPACAYPKRCQASIEKRVDICKKNRLGFLTKVQE